MALTQIGDTIAALMQRVSPEIRDIIQAGITKSPEEAEDSVKSLNAEPVSDNKAKQDIVQCYNCDACKGKMIIYSHRDGQITMRDCHCLPIRLSIIRAKSSGLFDLLTRCNFANYKDESAWQKEAKEKAETYAENPEGWLYMCGQVGAGKTHLCTAIVGQLIKSGKSARYMLWKGESERLKANINEIEYGSQIEPFLSTEALYIDDFLKTARGDSGYANKPSAGDINLAFSIINSRYNSKKITIISSEHTIDELLSYDEGLGSRIYERAKNNSILLPHGLQNNYRMRG